MTKAKLSEQAQQTVDRMKARFFLVQPDGTIKRRGEWAFNSETYVRGVAAKHPELKVYDRKSDGFLEAIATDAAVIAEASVEPVIKSGPTVRLISVGPPDAVLADVVDVGEALAAADLKPGDTEVHVENDHQPIEPAPSSTPILDKMVAVLADGKPRGKRPGRSKKDGRPRAVSAKADKPPKGKKAKVDRGVVIRR